MNGINKIFIAGNLASKPVLYKNKKGKSFSFLSVATNRFSLVEGQWVQRTLWHSILVWGKKAEICEKYLEKGAPLAIEGFLDMNHEDKPTIIAEDLHFLGLRTPDTAAPALQENQSDPLT